MWAEPSFVVYYPDTVYANPSILEIDLLLIFEGGYACVELKERPSRAVYDSLKFYVNGLASQPILYAAALGKPEERRSLRSEMGKQGVANPLIVNWFGICRRIAKLISRRGIETLMNERHKLFSLDNFLCAMLIYGSPRVCRALVADLKWLGERFELVDLRLKLLEAAKGLEGAKEGLGALMGSDEDSEPQRGLAKLVVMAATLSSDELRRRAARALADYVTKSGAGEVLVLCTNKSLEDAKVVCDGCSDHLRDRVRLSLELVQAKGEELEEKWAKRAVKLAGSDMSAIVLVGELPKGVLISLLERLKRARNKPKLAVLMWRARLSSEFAQELQDVLNCMRSEVKGREEVKLEVVELP